MSFLELHEVSYSIGDALLLDRVSIEVGEGELVGIIGPNGAGKSTALRIMAAEVEPTSGRVEYDGRDVENLSLMERARMRSLLPQQPVLRFGFTCLDVVRMGRYPYDESEVDSIEAARVALEITETADLADRSYPSLSGGEQARVALARVLAQQTPILLLDEPTASLDLRHQQTVMEALERRARGGGSVVAVLHDINLGTRFADRLIVLADGKVRATGVPDDIVSAELVSEVYDVAVTVVPHPSGGHPLVVTERIGIGS